MNQKRKLTVEEAVDEYIHFKLEETKIDLVRFLDEMTKLHGEHFQAETARPSGIEFVLARLAIDCHNLWFLFPDDDANRIFRLIFSKYLKFDELTDKEIADKLFAYLDILDAYDKAESTDLKTNLQGKFSENFLKVFLGQNIKRFYLRESAQKDSISPLVLRNCSKILFDYKVSWKAIRNTATIE